MPEDPEWYKSGWHKTFVDKYRDKQASYESLATKLKETLERACRQLGIWASIQSRPKTISSFAEKILRKYPKYEDPLQEMTDLAGVCVITLTQDDGDIVAHFIENEPGFEVDRKNSVDIRTRLRPNEFGYRAIHYIVSARSSSILGVEFLAGVRGLKAEIQIQTMLQHAWTKVGHDRIYKAELNVPVALQREVNSMAALLEEADAKFSQVIKALDTYRSGYQAYMDANRLHGEIRKLEAVHESDPLDVKVARTLAQLYAAREQWDKALAILTVIAEEGHSQDASVWRDFGFVLCRTGKIEQGRGALRTALEIDPKNVRAHCDLGDTYMNDDVKKALECYDEAFAARPHEPSILARYIEALICVKKNAGFLKPLRGALETAIAECTKRMDMKVDLPDSSFYIGRFHLFLGEPYESLYAYAKAVGFCSRCAPVQSELRAIERMGVAVSKGGLEGVEWVRRFLVTAVAAGMKSQEMEPPGNAPASPEMAPGGSGTQCHSEEATLYEDELRRIVHCPTGRPAFEGSVVIVAGGCDKSLEEDLRKQYGSLLEETFGSFEGTIICGGTRAGVSAMVGDLPNVGGRIHKIGYLPEHATMPETDQVHDQYVIRRTDGDGYTPLGPIHTWAELLLAGRKPQEVRVLGINGGKITAFEYRLALAMGAKVGLIEKSGRAVADLLPDFDWKQMKETLIPLPEDCATLAAFVNTGTLLSSTLNPQDREKAGEYQHKSYVRSNQDNPRRVYPSMLSWGKLGPVYRRSSIQQIIYAEHILRIGGWDIIPMPEGTVAAPPDAQTYGRKMRMMAELEHGRYNAERLCDGWRQGEDEPENRTNPNLIPWSDLKAAIRKYDYDAIGELPITLAWAGFEVVPASSRAKKQDGQAKPISPSLQTGDKPAQGISYADLVALPEWGQFREKMKQHVDLLVAKDEEAERQQH